MTNIRGTVYKCCREPFPNILRRKENLAPRDEREHQKKKKI
jgi:hypothetical protein